MHIPYVAVQRAAMAKLSFLLGDWSGEARVLRSPGPLVELIQTERAEYRLNGLLLLIEGLGCAKSDGSPALQALGIISFDDQSAAYRMRAYNDGRWLETEVTLAAEGAGMNWGFTLGEFKTRSELRINQQGEWTERADLTIGSEPPRQLLELAVRRQK